MTTIAITDELLSDLEAKAREATPGPWDWDEDSESIQGGVGSPAEGVHIAMVAVASDFGCIDYDEHPEKLEEVERECTANAHLIARANPRTVLALVAEVRRLRAFADDPDVKRAVVLDAVRNGRVGPIKPRKP